MSGYSVRNPHTHTHTHTLTDNKEKVKFFWWEGKKINKRGDEK